MTTRRRQDGDRRHFLGTATGLVAAAAGILRVRAEEKPPATSPRATSGDAVEPRWEQRLTITVGPREISGSQRRQASGAARHLDQRSGITWNPRGAATPSRQP